MPARTAVTLIEVLIAVSILALVTVSTIPLLQGDVEARRLREGARAVSSYLNLARSKAMELGAPVGVMIERQPGSLNTSWQISLAEVPPPYCGDFADSRLAISGGGLAKFTTGDVGWVGLIRAGDLVKVNFQGGLQQIFVGDADASGNLRQQPWLLTAGTAPVRSTPPAGLPFQIYRQPVRSATQPLQLPEGVIVDLGNSGISSNEFASVDGRPLIVLFSPNGSLDRIYVAGQPVRSASRVYLLVARRERALAGQNATTWQDLESYWVTVQSSSGQVSTAENAPVDPGLLDVGAALPQARGFARTGQAIGGR